MDGILHILNLEEFSDETPSSVYNEVGSGGVRIAGLAIPVRRKKVPRSCDDFGKVPYKTRLSKSTVIAMLPEGSRTREYMESLRLDQWEITGFAPVSPDQS